MKIIKVGIYLLLLVAFIFNASPVYADTLDPDDAPTVEQVNIYHHLLEADDMLIVIYANIPYASLPDTPVTSTFIWRLIDTDNVTELGQSVGTNYNDDGYGYNVYSMYFDAANVTALGIHWDTVYTLRLSGNPAVFVTPPVYNFIINLADYSTATTQVAAQSELTSRILVLAADLDTRWGLITYSLLEETETARVLSIYGEAFFRGAIYGLQAMAPDVFSVVVRAIAIVDREWDPGYSENITAQWGGTWVDTAQAAGKALFGTDHDFLSILIMLAMCGGLIWGNIELTGDHWNGLVDVAILSVLGARLAMFDFAFLLLIAALCIVYIAAKIWYGLVK